MDYTEITRVKREMPRQGDLEFSRDRELKGLIRSKNLDLLKNFAEYNEQLGIVERDVPAKAESFFSELMMRVEFGTGGKVFKESAFEDIREILKQEIPVEIQRNTFYERWLLDMTEVSRSFCETLGQDSTCFSIGSQRGCVRYHIDSVPLRVLVTYAGKGTEWLPDEAANRHAYRNGEPNDKIVKDCSAIQFINQWDVAVFRGGPKGLLHRTPDAALNGPSILMRLDHPLFWDRVLKHHYEENQNSSTKQHHRQSKGILSSTEEAAD